MISPLNYISSGSPPKLLALISLALSFLLLACSERPPAAPQAEDSSPSIGPLAPTESAQVESAATTPDPAEKDIHPVFDLQRQGKKLILSGILRSEHQVKDIATALELDGFDLESQLKANPSAEGADWGNRISSLLPELVLTVPDLNFHVEKGIITIAGSVKNLAAKQQLQRAIIYTMESPFITGIENQLTALEGSKPAIEKE